MGIFGFLSKAHLEQNLAGDTLVQRVSIINDKIESQTVYIERQKAVITRSEKAIERTGQDFTQDIKVQENIINSAYERLQVLDNDVKAYTDQGKGFFKGDNIKKGVELRKQQKPERDKLQPLEKKLINLEAEIGPVKYIAALAVDWGITDKVDTSEAVRWVILIIICVFDPLAVLLLIAANQSFMRRFPPTPPKPQEIIDLEKPDDDGIILELNQATANKKEVDKIEKQIKDWQAKLKKFNEKAPKPSNKPVEFINKKQAEEIKIKEFDRRMKEDEERLEEVSRQAREELEKSEPKGFDVREHVYDMDPIINPDWDNENTSWAKREAEEKTKKATLEEALKLSNAESVQTVIEPTISEQIETAMADGRLKPDLTEVIEPENKFTENKEPVEKSKKTKMKTIIKE